MTAINSDFFETKDTNLMGKKTDKLIRSDHFIYSAGKKLIDAKESEHFGEYLKDFALTLKAIVKAEMLAEMQKSIENLDTFYR